MRLNEFTQQSVQEDSGYNGSEPLDLSKSPSVNDVFKRALYIYDYEGYGNDGDYSEDDAIDQYVERNFGENVLDQLNKARYQSYFGREGGNKGGHIRSSNLGTAGAPSGNFRTTKAGKMHSQDVKMTKNKIADRLGRHPEPELPEAYEPVSRPHGTYRSGIFSPNRGIARRSLTAVDKVLQKPLVTQQNTNRINFLLDLVPDRKLKELYGVLAYEHFPFDDLRDLPWFMKRLNLLIARAEQRLSQEQGVAEGQGDFATALSKISGSWSGWHKEEDMSSPDIDVYEYDDGEGGYYGRGTIEHNLKSGEVKVEYHDSENEADVVGTFKNMGDAMRALRGEHGVNHGGQAPNFDRLGQRKQHGPNDLRKTDRTGRKGTLAGGPTNSLKQAIQWNKGKHGPKGTLPESMEEGDLYSMALQRYPQLKQVSRETVINALNNAYEDYLMHYGYEGIGPDEESSMIDHAVKGLKQGVSEAGNNYHANRTGFSKPSGQRDDERHDLDAPRPLIYGLKINGKIWKKDGNTVTFFTKERALAAKNSMLNKRPELEITLVQRPQD